MKKLKIVLNQDAEKRKNALLDTMIKPFNQVFKKNG
jgi:hypothetical protein